MWYLQFFFYAWGAANIPQRLDSYVNWMLHMSIYVLCAGLVGLALGEWAGVTKRPIRLLWAGILVIIAAATWWVWEWHRRLRIGPGPILSPGSGSSAVQPLPQSAQTRN
jgi:high-affinity Fe2+/Pb2+ permease